MTTGGEDQSSQVVKQEATQELSGGEAQTAKTRLLEMMKDRSMQHKVKIETSPSKAKDKPSAKKGTGKGKGRGGKGTKRKAEALEPEAKDKQGG